MLCPMDVLDISHGSWRVQNTGVHNLDNSNSAIVEWTCDQNYIMTGQNYAKCMDEVWWSEYPSNSAELPKCKKQTCPPKLTEPPHSSKKVSNENYLVGTTVTYT